MLLHDRRTAGTNKASVVVRPEKRKQDVGNPENVVSCAVPISNSEEEERREDRNSRAVEGVDAFEVVVELPEELAIVGQEMIDEVFHRLIGVVVEEGAGLVGFQKWIDLVAEWARSSRSRTGTVCSNTAKVSCVP